MKKIKIILFFFAFFLSVTTIWSKPAMREIRKVIQPDGSLIEVKVSGDENFHFTTTPNGVLLVKDNDGFYRIASVEEDGSFKSTGEDINEIKNGKGLLMDDSLIGEIKRKRSAFSKVKSRGLPPQSGMGLYSNTYPVFGNPKCLIILVEYSDVKFNTSYDAKSYFNNMIKGENFTEYGGTGSVLEYFRDQSGGKFMPDFDIYGPVALPNTQSYYGRNDRYGEDQNAHLMVTDAISILDPSVDFSQYDTDGDGVIDNVYIFYAGQGEADYGVDDTVWPHSAELQDYGLYPIVDNVRINRYACSNEWSSRIPDGIGTFAHEFSHVLGLPDLYNTYNSRAEYTPGSYSLLDYGCYNNNSRTPSNFGAYEKNAMGWFEPIMLNDELSVTLRKIDTGDFGLMPTEKENEFFLFENRQLEGWDAYIPNHGMLIWHIDYDQNIYSQNIVNNNPDHQYVDIVEANNRRGGNYQAGYTFPGTTNNTSFTSETTPAFKSFSNRKIDYPITNITENNGLIYFDVAGGANNLLAPDPSITEYSEKDGYFTISWSSVGGATDYYINVSLLSDEAVEGKLYAGFDDNKIPSGWEASSTGWYVSESNYGLAAPSLKFANNGQTLTSEETESDITKIEFWAKGQNSDRTKLLIEGLGDGAWVPIVTYDPLKNVAENVVIDSQIPSGVRKIRFTLSKVSGNIALDDVTITYGSANQTLPDYNNVSTNGETSYRVDKMLEAGREYKYSVTATDGKKTKTSTEKTFIFKGESDSGVGSLWDVSNEGIEFFNLQGFKIENPGKGEIVIMKQGNKVRKVLF